MCHLVPLDIGAVFPGTEAGWTSSGINRCERALAWARNCAAGSMATKKDDTLKTAMSPLFMKVVYVSCG